ncbi:MAG: hypothetical protein IJU66_05970 [Oscillospiraceae bacterium]|nr:hypothetical protein [Oscillospiraceae bacterium]
MSNVAALYESADVSMASAMEEVKKETYAPRPGMSAGAPERTVSPGRIPHRMPCAADFQIDDGSELFGTKSGDGFADLAAYDEDGNGWIDESDSVFAKLRVWVRGSDGDRLLDLKEANVGAIYLGSADTEFTFKDSATNETNGVMRRTGVYLRETGEAGTISHVDLRC